MRKVISFLLVLTLAPVLMNTGVACSNSSIFTLKDLLKQIDKKEIHSDVLINTTSEQLRSIVAGNINSEFLKIIFSQKNQLSDFFIELLWELERKNQEEFFAKPFIEDGQIWDLAKNEPTTIDDLAKKLKEKGTIDFKLVASMPWNPVSLILHLNVNEKTNEDMEKVINNCDYDRNGLFNWFFMLANFQTLFHGIALDKFTEIFIDFLKNKYFYYCQEVWYLLDWEADDVKLKASFEIKEITNNDHELTQTDLDQPGELKLTFVYEAKSLDGKDIRGVIINPLLMIIFYILR